MQTRFQKQGIEPVYWKDPWIDVLVSEAPLLNGVEDYMFDYNQINKWKKIRLNAFLNRIWICVTIPAKWFYDTWDIC